MHDDPGFFFTNHPDPMFVYAPETLKFLAVNRAAAEIYGYSPEEFLDMTIAALRPAEDMPRLMSALKRAKGKRIGGYIWRHRTKTGNTLLVDIVSQPINWLGHPARLVIARNVTATAQLQTFFEALPGKFLVIDPIDYSIVAASDDYLKATSRQRNELKGRCLFDTFPNDPNDTVTNDVSILKQSFLRVKETCLSDTLAIQRYPILRPESEGGGFEERFWSMINSPIKGSDDHVNYIIHRVEDVTDFVRLAGENRTLSPQALENYNAHLATEILLRSREQRETNQRLKQQDANLRLAQRLLSLGIWHINLKTGALYWSDNLYEICGLSAGETEHTAKYVINQLMHPDDRANAWRMLEHCQRDPSRPLEFTHRIIRPCDDKIVYFRGMAELHHNEPILAGVILDVTQEVKTRQRLDAAAGMQRIADRAAKLGGWRVNLHENFVRWSPQTALVHERPALLRPNVKEAVSFYVPEHRQRIQAVFNDCITHGEPFDEILQIETARSKKRAWVRSIGEPLRNELGQIVGAQGAFQDISEQVAAQETSAALAQRLALTLDSMSDAFYLLDKDFMFAYLNPQAEKLLRTHRKEWVGNYIYDVFPATEHSEVGQRLGRAFAQQKSEEFTVLSENFNAWFEINAHPNPDGVAVYFRDVTERHEMTERLNQAQKMEALGQLTGGVAHDFNNLLTVIMGNAELLKEQLSSHPNLQFYVEMTANAAARGAELTNRLLTFARRQTLEPKHVDINKLLTETEHLLRRTLSENIELQLIRTAGTWPTNIDPSQLESAILNLAINARDVMPEGGKLTIEAANAYVDDTYTTAHADIAPGQYVMISISDTGSGMTAEVLSRLYEPFFTTKPVGKGSGLGLPMVYGFVKQSGGYIKIYSEENEGTTIRLYFPRAYGAGPVSESSQTCNHPQSGNEHVLVVEDDHLVRDHVTHLLVKLGYRITSAGSGASALAKLKQHHDIDLLFTDIMMPGGINGRQLARQALALNPRLKVLYTSGYTENAITHHGHVDASIHLLSKPYRRHELANKLRKVLDEKAKPG